LHFFAFGNGQKPKYLSVARRGSAIHWKPFRLAPFFLPDSRYPINFLNAQANMLLENLVTRPEKLDQRQFRFFGSGNSQASDLAISLTKESIKFGSSIDVQTATILAHLKIIAINMWWLEWQPELSC
jgi:hypothetical protein